MRPLFFGGRLPEQALAKGVKDLGKMFLVKAGVTRLKPTGLLQCGRQMVGQDREQLLPPFARGKLETKGEKKSKK